MTVRNGQLKLKDRRNTAGRCEEQGCCKRNGKGGELRRIFLTRPGGGVLTSSGSQSCPRNERVSTVNVWQGFNVARLVSSGVEEIVSPPQSHQLCQMSTLRPRRGALLLVPSSVCVMFQILLTMTAGTKN